MIFIGVIIGLQCCMLSYISYKMIRERNRKVIPVVYAQVCTSPVRHLSPGDKDI